MALVDLDSIKAQLTSGSISDAERDAFKTLLFTILTKAARVDLHADAAEVAMIQEIMAEYTGEQYDAGTIRAEAIAQAQEESLRGVKRLAGKLPESLCVLAIAALEKVMRADEHISYTEIDYFNAVAGAMRLSFADVAGLFKD